MKTRIHPRPELQWLWRNTRYDPSTGQVWVWRPRAGRWSSDSLMANGYSKVQWRSLHLAVFSHHIAWSWLTGRWPERHIDHVNRNRSDNRAANLRDVSQSENIRNSERVAAAVHICRRKPSRRYPSGCWQVKMTMPDGSRRSTTRRDFCAVVKLRQQWLADRDAMLAERKEDGLAPS